MVALLKTAAWVAAATISASATAARKFIPPLSPPLSPSALMPALEQQLGASLLPPPPDARSSREQLARIYCAGDLLREVQLAALFEDSKHFVDMPLKASTSAAAVLAAFPALLAQREQWSDREWRAQLERFIDRHFDPPGSDLAPAVPRDFQDGVVPAAIARVAHPRLRAWALEVHAIWKQLGRVPRAGVVGSFLQPEPVAAAPSSPLGRPEGHAHNVLVVPGGRFRESYYWDSYWIVHGLLASGLRATARGVVNNLLEYVAELGFVPNGGRVYYLSRSQPPLLTDMVRLVASNGSRVVDVADDWEAADWDVEYLRAALPLLEREYAFWMRRGDNASLVAVQPPGSDATYELNRYVASAGAPRPESFREDYLHARMADNASAHANANANATRTTDEAFYNEVIAAAESGWDFSSRWLADGWTLRSIATSRVVPVELNAALFRVESALARFHSLLGSGEASHRFALAASRRKEAMDAVLWSDAHGAWKDYWWRERRHAETASVSDYSPLWARAFGDSARDRERVAKAVASLASSGLVQRGGAQTTTHATGQQWDAPNAWPPEQDRLVEGLLATRLPAARALAAQLVEAWLASGLAAWTRTGHMFEKYNASELGGIGCGGEYVPQLGFGWSNGVLLRFLTEYAHLVDADAVLALAATAHSS